MRKLSLLLFIICITVNAKAQKVINNTNCLVSIYIHCLPEGICDNVGILYGPSGPFKFGIPANSTLSFPSPHPTCSQMYPEPTPPPPFTFLATPTYEFVIENDDNGVNCPDLFISPPTYVGPNCYHHVQLPTVTSDCGCLTTGQTIYVDYNPATNEYTVHY